MSRWQAEKYLEEMTALRRELHRRPELSTMETGTQRFIMDYLSALAPDELRKCGGNGVKAVFLAKNAVKTVALRADMDALPVTERTGVEFASQNCGVMHACGHDGHMAMLLGAAKYISQNRDTIKNNVVLVFEPAEEAYGGAALMIADGALRDPNVDRILGMHMAPFVPLDSFGVKDGPLMAQACEFDIEISGLSAHGATPDKGADAVAALCELITCSQGIISRTISPVETAVLTYGHIYGGTCRNIIAEKAVAEGTMRTFSGDNYYRIKNAIISKGTAIAEAYGCTFTFREKVLYPAVCNPKDLTAEVSGMLEGAGVPVEAVMIAEDYSYYQHEVPGVFLFLGCGEGDTPQLHSERFTFNERALANGLGAYIEFINS